MILMYKKYMRKAYAGKLRALRYWLSIPFFDSSHLCSCGSTLDPHGDHLLGCGQGPLWIRHHDVLTYILFQALLQDNRQVKREQRIFSSSAVRPGDIFHPDFSDGKPTYFDISVRNSLLPHFLSRASLVAGVASSAGEMDKDAKYDHNVSSAGCVFFPLVVETLGLWTDSSISLLRRIAARTTLHSGVSQGQAFHNLLQQLSVKLWSYNAKMLLRHISLLPVTESDPLDQSLFSLEDSSHCNDVNFNGIPCGAVAGRSPVYSQVSESSSSLNMSHSIVSPEVYLGVPVRNRFASLSDECATPDVLSDSSNEETVKKRSRGRSDHSSDDLDISADLMMHLSSSQEFQPATLGSKFEKQREKTHGGKLASSEAYSVSIMCDTSNCIQSQAPNQEASQQLPVQPQQSSTQKSHPANATPTTISADQHITMSSRRLRSTSPSLHQPKELEKAEASQKFYSIDHDYNSRAPSSQHQIVREKNTVTGDNQETRFLYAPSHHHFKQFPPSFQQMAQEQLANQQQQQQQSHHSQNNKYNYSIAHYTSIPANSQVPTLKRDNGHSNFSMDDVFMPRDDPVDVSDEEMDEFDRELENFKRFCFMANPLGNRPKVVVKMNLRGFTLNSP